MNNIISDWNFEGDLPVTGQKNPTGADHDLVELLWRNGSVILHSQTHRKQSLINPPMNDPPRQAQTKVHEHNNNQATRPYGASGNNNMALAAHQEDETVSWIHFPMEDSFEKEFCSNFFSELPSSSEAIPLDPTPPKLKTPPRPDNQEGQMPPPLSHCGSNQLAPNDLNDVVSWVSSSNGNTTGFSAPPPCFKGEGGREKASFGRRVGPPRSESGKTETLEPTLTSSSGGSGSSFGRGCKQSTTTSGNTNNKRKSRDQVEELECQSEAAELRSAAANKSAQRSGNSRKSRAAEVHNLSERRRRDRINEKMKALQELIPHSNKTDKASMLDEAIEYLKSLQLQLQVMWMGSGMTPMMFPGMQHYMSRMSMAMGPPAMPSMHMPPRVPMVDHQAAAVAPLIVGPTAEQHQQGFNPLNFQNHQMQGASFPDQYARFMGWNPMQQPVNLFRFNPQTVQQGQSIAQQGIMSTGPSSCVGAPIDGSALSGKMG